MITYRKTKPLIYVLRDLGVGETVIIPNTQARMQSVRDIVRKLKMKGIILKATQKGLVNKIQVTKISNNI